MVSDRVSNNQYNTKDVVVEMVSDRVLEEMQYNTKDGKVP